MRYHVHSERKYPKGYVDTPAETKTTEGRTDKHDDDGGRTENITAIWKNDSGSEHTRQDSGMVCER
jgi:hypothetical protein